MEKEKLPIVIGADWLERLFDISVPVVSPNSFFSVPEGNEDLWKKESIRFVRRWYGIREQLEEKLEPIKSQIYEKVTVIR